MPLDLKTVEIVSNSRLVARTWPNPVYVEGLYSLMQRVYMCLVTEPGDVEDDPSYGGGIRSALLGIPGQLEDRAHDAMLSVLDKVTKDLQANPSPNPAERLRALTLDAIAYDTDVAAWRCQITVSSAVDSASFAVNA